MKNKFMEFKQLNEEATELHIYGEIRKLGFFDKLIESETGEQSEDVGAYSFKDMLSQVKTDKLIVRINSMGGSVSEALAIYNQLTDFKGELVTKVDGFAASAASVIFMAGTERIVPSSSLLMIHNAWAAGQGNAKDFRKMADDLDKISEPSVKIYSEKTGQSEALIKQMLEDETWISSTDAMELGFATKEIKEDVEMSFQQNAMISLVKNNSSLKQELNIAKEELIAAEQTIKEKEPTPLTEWEKFFQSEK